jgi:Tfp pilus assembly protein PilN
MIEINLLPKEYQKRGFQFSLGKTGVYAIAGAAGVVLLLIGVTFYQVHQLDKLEANISRAKERAAMLQKDIRVVEALEDVKQKITRRMAAVERLDRNRSVWTRLLEDLSSNVPEFVWLHRLDETSEGSTAVKDTTAADPSKAQVKPAEIEGHAFTLNSVANFMINLMRSDYFDHIELVSTNEVELEGHKAYNFLVKCDMHLLSDERARSMIAQNDKAEKKDSGASHRSLN